MKKTDILIVGAGPAGLGAAIEAAKAGAAVLLIDENLKAGGQRFKQIHKFFGSEAHYAGTRGFQIGEKLLEEAANCMKRLRTDAALAAEREAVERVALIHYGEKLRQVALN